MIVGCHVINGSNIQWKIWDIVPNCKKKKKKNAPISMLSISSDSPALLKGSYFVTSKSLFTS